MWYLFAEPPSFSLAMHPDLPNDIIDYIISHIPDLRTLCSLIKTSKHIYTVYKTHERWLTAAVARNEVGSALPAALHLARISLSKSADGFDIEWRAFTENSSYEIDWKLAKELSANAAAVSELERFYSQTFKDRTSRASQLTASEFHKLARAIYRLKLYCEYWTYVWDIEWDERDPRWANPLDSEDEEDELAEWAETCAPIRKNQAAFMRSMASNLDEQRELRAAFLFLKDYVAPWASIRATNVITRGVTVTLNYDAIHVLALMLSQKNTTKRPRSGFFHGQDEVLYALTRTQGEDIDSAAPTLFLDAPSEDCECERCGLPAGQKLFNHTNWDLLSGYLLARDDVCRLGFKGYLMINGVEQKPINDYFVGPAFSFPVFFRQLILRTNCAGGDANEDLWLCESCVRRVVEEETMPWWLERKRAGGQPIPEDCEWGFNCLPQAHEREHAENFNHFCHQTRPLDE